MPDIGNLNINLSANTASFSGPLSKAQQQARDAARGIKAEFDKVDLSEARGGIMLLGEEIGVHLPRHVQSFIATLPGVGAAMSAAFPVLAVVAIGVAIFEVAEKLTKLHEAAEKLSEDQTKFGTVADTVFNSLDDKLLQAGIKTDELNNDHMAALKKQLELIDHQSMSELGHTFDILAKAADVVFADLQSHWYSWGVGSDKAKSDLEKFKTQYDSLLAQNKDADAANLLTDTRAQQQRILDIQREGVELIQTKGLSGEAAMAQFKSRSLELAQAGRGLTDNEVKAQEQLVSALNDQAAVQVKVAALKAAQKANDQKETGNKVKDDTSKVLATQLQADLSRIAEVKAAATEAYVAMGHSMEDAKVHEDALFGAAELQAHLDYYEKLKATAKTAADLNKINTDEQIFLNQETAKASDQLAQTESKNIQGVDKLEELSFKEGQNQQSESLKQAMATAAAKSKAQIDAINLVRGETEAEAEASALQQVHAFQRIADIGEEIKQLQKLRDQQLKNGQDTLAVDAAIHNAQLQKLKDQQAELLAANHLGGVFKAVGLQMKIDASQVGQSIFQTLNQAIQGLNSSLADFVTTGQANWSQLAQTAISSIIQIGLQYAETQAATAILDALGLGEKKAKNAESAQSSASAAAANALADVPFPENIPASISVLATGEAYAADALAERGAVLPNRDMLVHTHPEEMILPQHISNFIVNAASRSGNDNQPSQPNGPVYAPTINAGLAAAKDVDKALKGHFDGYMRKEARRRGVRY